MKKRDLVTHTLARLGAARAPCALLPASPPDPMINRATHRWLVLVAVLLSGCGGGGGGGGGDGGTGGAGGGGGGSGGGTGGTGTAPLQTPDPVAVSGVVTFDSVPSVPGFGLDYFATEAKPARGVTVELLAGGTVLATTTTDSAGAYTFTVSANTDVALRARAEMRRTGSPSWTFKVVDNVSEDALYALDGAVFNTGTVAVTRDLHAGSGWGGSAYTGVRAAAPFAILDTIYDGVALILGAAPDATFPPLDVHWSTANVPSVSSDGAADVSTGEIGNSFFRAGAGIFLLGAEDTDTDEYDRHVVAHEWGHYVEHAFARSDSIGGPHTRHDQLDFRVAFGEGWGNAFSAMVVGDSVYRDAFGPGQSTAFAFDVEGPLPSSQGNQHPGWYSEESVQEVLYDLFDGNVDLIRNSTVADNVALGFAPLYAVLTSEQKSTIALASLFPFVAALRARHPAEAPLIDEVVGAQDIGPISDGYGTAEVNFGSPPSADLQSVYDMLTVNDSTPARVCSLDEYRSTYTGSTNKLGSRRFLRFAAAGTGPHTITARAVAPLNDAADPDMVLHRGHEVRVSESAPTGACDALAPAQCVETFSPTLASGDYVLEVYEWTNTNSETDDAPPIGRTCFDVTVTYP